MLQARVGDKRYTADSNPASDYPPAVIAKARAFQWFSLAYCAAAVIYVIFTVSTQTGLGGYALAIEMETFGSAAALVTGGLLWLALFVPLLALPRNTEED